jgi:hypothetical protein
MGITHCQFSSVEVDQHYPKAPLYKHQNLLLLIELQDWWQGVVLFLVVQMKAKGLLAKCVYCLDAEHIGRCIAQDLFCQFRL